MSGTGDRARESQSGHPKRRSSFAFASSSPRLPTHAFATSTRPSTLFSQAPLQIIGSFQTPKSQIAADDRSFPTDPPRPPPRCLPSLPRTLVGDEECVRDKSCSLPRDFCIFPVVPDFVPDCVTVCLLDCWTASLPDCWTACLLACLACLASPRYFCCVRRSPDSSLLLHIASLHTVIVTGNPSPWHYRTIRRRPSGVAAAAGA